MNLLPSFANTAWLAASAPAHRRFVRALQDPDTAQERVLRMNLARNAASVYGRAHDFAHLPSYADFARRVPIVSYEELAPYIDRVRGGERGVLTCEPVTRLVPTSGTTGGRKLIPFTASLQHEFNAAIGPWLVDLARQQPAIRFGPGYWSVSPLGADFVDDESTVPIGFDDDAHFLGGVRARLIENIMAVPPAVRHIGDIDAFRHVVLLHLLRQRDLRLISVWHPSFLALLLDALSKNWDALLSDLASGTCNVDFCSPARLPAVASAKAGDRREKSHLWRGDVPLLTRRATRNLRLRPAPERARQLRTADPTQPESIWPKLRVVSCWADGNASGAAADLQRRLPHTLLQPKGLLATEAFVTFPFRDAHPLALHSHFFEFRDERGAIQRAGALRVGGTYEVIATTGGGLYRYALGDRVEVTRLIERTPCLRFLGRERGSDRCGEKLSEAFVAEIITTLFPRARFALLAPEQIEATWRYTLFLEGEITSAVTARLDAALCANPHYALCRRLGQLGAAAIFHLEHGGYAAFTAAETARGLRLGDIKPVALSPRSDWAQHFARVSSLAMVQ